MEGSEIAYVRATPRRALLFDTQPECLPCTVIDSWWDRSHFGIRPASAPTRPLRTFELWRTDASVHRTRAPGLAAPLFMGELAFARTPHGGLLREVWDACIVRRSPAVVTPLSREMSQSLLD